MKTRATQTIKILALAVAGVIGAFSFAPAAPVQGAPAEAAPGYTRSRFRGVSVRHVPSASPSTSRIGTGSKAAAPNRGLVLRNRRRARRPQDGIVADVDPASFPSEIATISPSGRVTIGHGAEHERTRRSYAAHTMRSSAKKPASRGAAKR